MDDNRFVVFIVFTRRGLIFRLDLSNLYLPSLRFTGQLFLFLKILFQHGHFWHSYLSFLLFMLFSLRLPIVFIYFFGFLVWFHFILLSNRGNTYHPWNWFNYIQRIIDSLLLFICIRFLNRSFDLFNLQRAWSLIILIGSLWFFIHLLLYFSVSIMIENLIVVFFD
jgi:hypothetical protein